MGIWMTHQSFHSVTVSDRLVELALNLLHYLILPTAIAFVYISSCSYRMLRLFNRFHVPHRRYSSSFRYVENLGTRTLSYYWLANSKLSSSCSSLIDIKPNILTALRSNRPVVALESTIITHGMPYPHNIETAAEVEEIIRQEVCDEKHSKPKTFIPSDPQFQNAIPATIAILNGRIKVGLSPEELVALAQFDNNNHQSVETVKVSRRDMAYVVSKQINGGTTVAGTLIVANMLGINVFATGGIGKMLDIY